jgi:hypothetical protein
MFDAPSNRPRGDTRMPEPDAATEVETLLSLIRARYGERLTPEQLADVKKGVESIVDGARALRAVKLGNADEPMQPFAPYRADG